MAYVVNKDVANPLTIHDTVCKYAEVRRKNPANGRWSPEFASYQDAWNWAMANQKTRMPKDCGMCKPVH